MGTIYQHDKRSGITYTYESKAYWGREKGQSRAKRTLVRRVDEKTGEIAATDGRAKKASERAVTPDYKAPWEDLAAIPATPSAPSITCALRKKTRSQRPQLSLTGRDQIVSG